MRNLTRLTPNTIVRNPTHLKAASYSTFTENDIKITALLPNDYDHFEEFKKIITDESILFSSTTMQKIFDFREIHKKCSHTKIKLQLIDAGDTEIALPKEVIEAHNRGVPYSKIALDRFFAMPVNGDKLREIYLEMTGRTQETGLGYYKFENTLDNKLLGGGALAPISKGIPVEKVDVALHILDSKKGIGSFCLNRLLTKAFEEHGVQQVWGTSIIDHSGTSTLGAKYGMMIKNQDGMKYYFIDKEMWKTNKEKMQIMDDPHVVLNQYGRNNGKGGRS